MKQQIKCPHCNKVFPIEDSIKHEAEEIRKNIKKKKKKNQKSDKKNLKKK